MSEQHPGHSVRLTDYEVANLRALIEACGYPYGAAPDSPLKWLGTGDWLGQVYLKLPQVDYAPNASPAEMVERVTKMWALP